eukprot:2980422-Pyramimonas_sp.AAC.1
MAYCRHRRSGRRRPACLAGSCPYGQRDCWRTWCCDGLRRSCLGSDAVVPLSSSTCFPALPPPLRC